MLANLKCAIKKKNLETTIYYNKLCLNILNKLKNFGYILGFQIISSNKLKIFLKYIHNKSMINNIRQYTSSKKKYYKTYLWIKKYCKIGWEYIFLTNKGLLWNNECLFFKKGGLLPFSIN